MEEKITFKENCIKIGKAFLVSTITVLIMLFLFKDCTTKEYYKLQGEYKQLEKNYELQKKKVDIIEKQRIKEKDSLSSEIIKRENINKQLISDNKTLETKINVINNKVIKVPKDVKGLVSYYNDRYNTTENKVVEDKVGLTANTAYNASYELEEKDKLTSILSLKDEQIKKKDFQIFNLEKDKVDFKKLLETAEKENEKRKLLEQAGKESINNLKEQVSKLNTKDNLNKILVPASFIAGGFIGYQLNK